MILYYKYYNTTINTIQVLNTMLPTKNIKARLKVQPSSHLVNRSLVERVGDSEVPVQLPMEGCLSLRPGHRGRLDGLEAVLAEEHTNHGTVWQVELVLYNNLLRRCTTSSAIGDRGTGIGMGGIMHDA